MRAFIDAYLLIFPSGECQPDEFDSYLRNLLSWRDLVLAEAFPVYISVSAASLLGQFGGFPSWRILNDTVKRLQIPNVEAKDVFSVLQRFLDRIPKIEDSLGIREVLFDNVECNSDAYKNRPSALANAFEQMVTFICLFKQTFAVNEPDYIFSRRYLPCPADVDFRTQLVDIEYESNKEDGKIVPPKNLEALVTILSCPRNARLRIVPEQMWSRHMSVLAFEFAVNLTVEQMKAVTGRADMRNWRLGKNFIPSITRLNLGTTEKGRTILRALAETILDENMKASHPLRINSAPNSSQVFRGKDGAWRRDIDDEFHLHYWSGAQGLEFAVVVVHNDFDIP